MQGASFGAKVTVLDEIVCKVNGDIVTRIDLERDRQAAKARTDLLRDRIDAHLLVQRGKDLSIGV